MFGSSSFGAGSKKKAAKETKKKGVEKKKKKSKDTVKKNKRSNSKKACQDVQSISTDGVLNFTMNKLDVIQSEPLNKEEPKRQLKSPFQNPMGKVLAEKKRSPFVESGNIVKICQKC